MNERLDELLPLYALGALTDEERAEVDAYVAARSQAQAQLADLMRTAGALPFAAAPVDPGGQVKSALMMRVRERVREDASNAGASRAPAAPSTLSRFKALRFRPATLLAGASLIAVVVIGLWAMSLNAEVARLRDETAALRRELALQNDVIAQITSPAVRAMALLGTQVQPGARGQLLADPGARSAVLVVSGLSPLPQGRVYQFWLIRGDTPVSAGTFRVDDRGRAVLPIESADAVGSFGAMGVSVEPDGGSLQPTGDIVMLSELSS